MTKRKPPKRLVAAQEAIKKLREQARRPKTLEERLVSLERRIEALERDQRDRLAGYPGYD